MTRIWAVLLLILLQPALGRAQETAATPDDSLADTLAQAADSVDAAPTAVDSVRGAVFDELVHEEGAPVVVGRDTVLTIYGEIPPFTLTERAEAVAKRIDRIMDVEYQGLEVVQLTPTAYQIKSSDVSLMVVTGLDVAGMGVSQQEAIDAYVDQLDAYLKPRAGVTSWREILIGAGLSVVAALVLWLLIRIVNRFFPWLYLRLRAALIGRLESHHQEFLSTRAPMITEAVLFPIKVMRWLAILILIYWFVPLVLSFFPPTRHFATEWILYFESPFLTVVRALIGYIPNLIFITVVAIITMYGLRLMKVVFRAIDREALTIAGFYPDWAMPTYKLVRVVFILLAFVVVWPYLPQSDSTAFKGVAAFLGLLISLGSASAFANLMGGVVMIYMRPFTIGDFVEIANTKGEVMEKTMLVTRLRTPKNVIVTLPNSLVLGNQLVNYTVSATEGKLLLHTEVTIGYDVPWRDVHDMMLAAARATEGVLNDPEPFVLQRSLGDFSIAYELNAYTHESKRMPAVYSELHENIQDEFARRNVEILSPIYAATREGPSTVPKVQEKSDGGA